MILDAMVLIHLAKITLLKKSCEHFKSVEIPEAVYNEIWVGKRKGYADAAIIIKLVEDKEMNIKKIKNKGLTKKAEEFNMQGGEADAVALYWQEKADYLATDDDNVRKKSTLLGIKVIGTPSIILKLYKQRVIPREKFEESLDELRKIGWFSNSVIDKIFMEGLQWEKQ